MNTQIQQFYSKEFGSLEVMMIDSKLFFPAAECAKVLGYKNPHKAVIDHCKEDGLTIREVIDGLGRKQEKKYITEGNLYRLIIRSKLPAADRFERWIFDEVLPTIRKYGAYIVDDILDAAEKSQEFALELFGMLQAEKSRNDTLTDKLDALAPKARYCDIILQSKNAVPVSIIAKDYGMSAAAFNRLLHGLRIQYKVGGAWVPYQQYAGRGYTKSRTYVVNETTSAVHTYWTQRGRLFLYETLKACGILPLMEAGQCSFVS